MAPAIVWDDFYYSITFAVKTIETFATAIILAGKKE